MATAQEWKERISRWKASGTTATEFAARHGLSSRKLYDWCYRLRKTEVAVSKSTPKQATSAVRLLRVVSSTRHAVNSGPDSAPSAIRLTMAGASVDIHAGFDEATLRRVLCVVKSLRDGAR